MGGFAVFAKRLTVVGQQHDHRAVVEIAGLEELHEAADELVRAPHARIV